MTRLAAFLRALFAPVPAPPLAYAVVRIGFGGKQVLARAATLDAAGIEYRYWRSWYASCGAEVLPADTFGSWMLYGDFVCALVIRPVSLADEPLPLSDLIPFRNTHIAYTLPSPRVRSVN